MIWREFPPFFFFFFEPGVKLDEKSIENGLEGQKFLVVCLFWGGCHHPNYMPDPPTCFDKVPLRSSLKFTGYLVVSKSSTVQVVLEIISECCYVLTCLAI